MAANWLWSVGPWKAGASALPALSAMGGPAADLATATGRSLRVKLSDPSEASITVDGTSLEAALLEELVTDLWVYRDGVCLFRGRADPFDDSGDETGRHTTAVTFTDYRGVLDRRIRWIDRTWSAIELSTVVWDAIVDMQAEAGGNYGIIKGTWPVTGYAPTSVIILAGDTIWSFIKKMTQLAPGFDFDIDENLHAQFYTPSRGKGLGLGAVLDYGGAVAKYQRRWDPDAYANGLRQSGADGVGTTFTTVLDIATRREGRWETSFVDSQLTTADMVTQTAANNLLRSQLFEPSYSLTLRKGAWGGPAHVWLGDLVTVVIRGGRLFEQATALVTEIQIDVDASNEETVTVVTGEAFVDEGTVLRKLAQQVHQITKR
jgi:hypothetical protein